MVMKRISFIEAGAPEHHVFRRYTMPRIGTVLLATILKERGYEVKSFIEDIAAPDWAFIENSDIVCISALTSTAVRAYSAAQRAKARGIPVIMGGAHPSFMPEEALNYCDFVVRGEGDCALTELLNYLDVGTPSIEAIPGLSYRNKTGNVLHNPASPLLKEEDLDALPIPDFFAGP